MVYILISLFLSANVCHQRRQRSFKSQFLSWRLFLKELIMKFKIGGGVQPDPDRKLIFPKSGKSGNLEIGKITLSQSSIFMKISLLIGTFLMKCISDILICCQKWLIAHCYISMCHYNMIQSY